jgi:hypothetical protein
MWCDGHRWPPQRAGRSQQRRVRAQARQSQKSFKNSHRNGESPTPREPTLPARGPLRCSDGLPDSTNVPTNTCTPTAHEQTTRKRATITAYTLYTYHTHQHKCMQQHTSTTHRAHALSPGMQHLSCTLSQPRNADEPARSTTHVCTHAKHNSAHTAMAQTHSTAQLSYQCMAHIHTKTQHRHTHEHAHERRTHARRSTRSNCPGDQRAHKPNAHIPTAHALILHNVCQSNPKPRAPSGDAEITKLPKPTQYAQPSTNYSTNPTRTAARNKH